VPLSILPPGRAAEWFRAPLHQQIIPALLAGLALRLFFIWRFPSIAGDTAAYEELARNWIDHGVYGIRLQGILTPVDLRAPGYPGFLATVYLIFGRMQGAVRLAQAGLDLVSCLLIARLAARIAGREKVSGTPTGPLTHVNPAALWLAALCPFTANYVAVILTESLAVFLTTAALSLLVEAWQRDTAENASPDRISSGWWLAAGWVTGLGALVRPETPILLVSAGLVLAAHWRGRRHWRKLIRTGVWVAAGVILSLLPWAARNWITLGRTQFLAARYAQLPGEYVPRGVYSWTDTWLVRFRDVFIVPWKLEHEPIDIDDLPVSAFDSTAERERVAALLDEYNDALDVSPKLDAQFAELARQRTRRHPLRTYFYVPLQRVATLWLTPRVEALPYSGHLWPLAQQYEDDPVDFSVTLGSGAVNAAYVGLGLAGLLVWIRRRAAQSVALPSGVALLVAFVAVRTIFFTQIETPEPRYVLECFPAVIALAAQVWPVGPVPT
jgi:4-amino-4-deoxy-L-arabinose transferase-like glycosyltransferase